MFLALRPFLLLTTAGLLLPATPPKPLQMTQGMIQQYEDGPRLLKPDSVTAGETIHFSFNLAGFARKEDRVAVSFTAQAFDPAGVPLAPALAGRNETTLTPQDKDWQPKLRGSLVLPELLFSGDCKLTIVAKDEISGTDLTLELPFRVAGPSAGSTASLEIRDLNFYSGDEAQTPLAVAAYSPGEEIHTRFLLTGYRHTDDTVAHVAPIHVAYGVKLTDATGKVLFENKDAAVDDTAEFYPKPYIPAQLAFTLKPGTPKGEFALEVTARDIIGNQQSSSKRSFRLE